MSNALLKTDKNYQILTIAVLLTCYNRKEKTIACLRRLFDQKFDQKIDLQVFLVDDGSTDQTASAVKELFSDVHIIIGNGSLFWAGGMRLAWDSAVKYNAKFDFYFLLNDDTLLYDNALSTMIADFDSTNEESAIIVGTTVDHVTKDISYGGRYLINNYSIAYRTLSPDPVGPLLCHLGNANAMLVSNEVYKKIGGLSSVYTHGIADYDYTLMAKKNGIKSYISRIVVGECQDDHVPSYKQRLKLRDRVKHLYSVKGLAFKEYLFFVKKYFPLYLPQAWTLLWLKTIFPSIYRMMK